MEAMHDRVDTTGANGGILVSSGDWGDNGDVQVLVSEGKGGEVAFTRITPENARALAALLVKHADRAEGK